MGGQPRVTVAGHATRGDAFRGMSVWVMPLEPQVLGHLAALPSAAGRTAVVTGGNAGLGRETALMLAYKGASVVITARNTAKAEEARSYVLANVPGADVSVEPLDLASLGTVAACAERLAEREIDILVCNAGVMGLQRSVTEDGFETQFGVNHLGHFALVGRLYDRLASRPGGRVVAVTSSAAYMGRIDFDDLMGERRYDRWRAYGQSKLANLLFAEALARRFATAGSATAHAAHPGLVFTQLQRRVLEEVPVPAPERWFLERLTPTAGQGPQMGALPQVFAALSPDATNGDFWGPRWFARGRPVTVRPPRIALDVTVQERLWAVSESLTGVAYGPRA